ncbi:hypothetical protein ACFFRR_007370 [Megaselia abdita]
MDTITNRDDYPDEEELSASALAFVRLQETYNLDATEISSGVIAGLKAWNSMSWDDCLSLGQQLYELGDDNRTQEWLREAFKKFSTKFTSDKESISILETIANMTLDINDAQTTLNITETILKVQPDHIAAQVAKEFLETLPKDFEISIDKPDYNPSVYISPQDFRTYEAVCRDEIKRSPSEIKDLHCKYVTYNNPFLTLAPFKLELLSSDPLIVMYHNVLYDSEITHLLNKSIPHIKRSTIGSATADQGSRSQVRTSHSTFTTYEGDLALKNLIQRVEDMTRQTIKGSELIQVANYGMGGHYEPHYDCFGPNTTTYVGYETEGDRISTGMFYASDLDLGGSTAFPFLRMNVKPVKGTMVFWYNLHASGNKDFRSLHAGCPVIKGSKWIFNIWMRIKPQMLYRKCELEDDTWKSKQFNRMRI